ncbi:alpha/beta fold hydrolase [Halobacteriaceae archaeon GCM10025711]
MNLRRVIPAVAGALGATALANRSLAATAGPLPPALAGREHTYRWRGFDVSYTEVGEPDAPDVLLLHGIHAAASAQEFDRIVDALAEDYHVVAPDLPGFGRSDRPAVTYTAELYRSFVADFAAEVTDRPTVIASSLTGAYAVSAARQDPDLFDRLVLVCPTANTGARRPGLRSLFRTPVVGTALFNLLTSKPSLRWFNGRDAYFSANGFDEATVDYQWRTAHQQNARFAPASFVGGFLDPDVDLGEELTAVDVPVTLVWGRDATYTPLALGRSLAEEADTRLVVFDRARLLPHAEHPKEFVASLDEELPLLEHE